MTVTVHWYDEKHTAILVRFKGNWTWQQYVAARAHMHRLQDRVTDLVDHIYDFIDVGTMPESVLSNFSDAVRTSHPKSSGLVVIVTDNAYIWTIGSAFYPIFATISPHIRLRFVERRDEVDMCLAIHRGQARA